ncbi:MAG: aerobic-type carbon monoxide dehydrogenase, small subunit CoxS/CutS-like protein [Acidimicrobiales bacterium]|nr:aerobic-type carbon monoxide dehydrogenase, small subunit CoxS/CutS-like protein [Acidimicrobiales bacterium]
MTALIETALSVNGERRILDVEPRTTLLDALRGIGLTGTHAGCEHGACGACTVLLDGETVRSCLVLAGQCGGREVTTIEGLGTPDALHPVMESFRRCHGLQCGFCTPGMVLTAVELLDENPSPTEAEVREALSGNICRCTGYAGIVAAVLDASSSVVSE